MKYAIIEQNAGNISIAKACELLKVRRQGYYEYLRRRDSARDIRDRQMTVHIKNIFFESNRIYGARKIREKLLTQRNIRISRKHVRRLMLSAGLVPVTWRKSVRTTVSDPKATPFPNLLQQDFRVALPNMTWVSDFTYIATGEGWAYLCTFIDLFSRRVVGWAVGNSIDRFLAIAALKNAVENRHPNKGFIIHTDRGCQYTSSDFRREAAAVGALQSMSRPGTPYDNACAETFFKSLKTECIERHSFKTRAQAFDAVAAYILFFNRVRIHASLGYSTPADFESRYAA